MNITKFTSVIKKYKKCPNCKSSWKDTKLKVELKEDIIKINCDCGFVKLVDENNKEVE